MKNQKGFTLIEVLIAATLIALVLGGLYTSFQTGLTAYRRSETFLMREHERDVFFQQLSQELRNSVPFTMVPFTGKTDGISFPARISHYSQTEPSSGLYLIEYKCQNGELSRRETKIKKESLKETNASPEVIFTGVQSCGFDFMTSGDALEPAVWKAEWSNNPYEGLPRGVRIQLAGGSFGNEPEEHKILIPQGILSKQI